MLINLKIVHKNKLFNYIRTGGHINLNKVNFYYERKCFFFMIRNYHYFAFDVKF